MQRTQARGIIIQASPWIDNIVARLHRSHVEEVKAIFHDLAEEVGLAHKDPTIDCPFLNLEVDWLTDCFRVSTEWCQKTSSKVQAVCRKQTNQLRTIWSVIGACSYYVYTTTRLLWQLRHTYSYMSQVARTQHHHGEHQINWQQPMQLPDRVKEELLAIVSSMLDPHPYFPIWHPPSLPQVDHMAVLVSDASVHGYGFHHLYKGKRIKASRTWSTATRPPKLPKGGHDQFSHEVAGLSLAMTETLLTHPPQVPILVVVDVQSIPRICQKQYCTHPAMMDLIMDLAARNITYYVSWGPGDTSMPADPESRLGSYSTVSGLISSQQDGQVFLDYIKDSIAYGQEKGYFTLQEQPQS
jgi:hypothetical protein